MQSAARCRLLARRQRSQSRAAVQLRQQRGCRRNRLPPRAKHNRQRSRRRSSHRQLAARTSVRLSAREWRHHWAFRRRTWMQQGRPRACGTAALARSSSRANRRQQARRCQRRPWRHRKEALPSLPLHRRQPPAQRPHSRRHPRVRRTRQRARRPRQRPCCRRLPACCRQLSWLTQQPHRPRRRQPMTQSSSGGDAAQQHSWRRQHMQRRHPCLGRQQPKMWLLTRQLQLCRPRGLQRRRRHQQRSQRRCTRLRRQSQMLQQQQLGSRSRQRRRRCRQRLRRHLQQTPHSRRQQRWRRCRQRLHQRPPSCLRQMQQRGTVRCLLISGPHRRHAPRRRRSLLDQPAWRQRPQTRQHSWRGTFDRALQQQAATRPSCPAPARQQAAEG